MGRRGKDAGAGIVRPGIRNEAAKAKGLILTLEPAGTHPGVEAMTIESWLMKK